MAVERTATQLIYEAAGHRLTDPTEGRCYLCGGVAYAPTPIKAIIKPTFNDFNAARGDMSAGICSACVWTMTQPTPLMQAKTGKDKPQTFRTYSHFVVGGAWGVYSKGQKAEMLAALLTGVMPEVCVVSESGQKHLAFKAQANPAGQTVGWVQFEEQRFELDLEEFIPLQAHIQALYDAGFTKEGIGTGLYRFYPDSDMAVFRRHETAIKDQRGSLTFALALYLTTKPQDPDECKEDNDE
jgi:hypothetical protein